MHVGSICNVCPLQATLRTPSPGEANRTAKSVSDERARISLGRENARALVMIIDSEFGGRLIGVIVVNKRHHACRASGGEVCGFTILEDDEAGLVVVVEQVGVDQELFRDDAVDPKLATLGILGSFPAVAARVHHVSKFVGAYLCS